MKKILILLFLLPALPLHAQEPVRFFIERIELRNLHRAGREIILSEGRLHEGAVYTEADLHDANDRIERLPFILDAQFSLEKGSQRDAYVLVIALNETRSFFYGLDLVAYHSNDEQVNVEPEEAGVSGIGFRWFAGRRGMFHVALGSAREYSSTNARQTGTVEAGYTQYGLFGSDAFASISVAAPIDGDQLQALPQVTLGIPLTRTQTLTSSFTSTNFESTTHDHYRRKALRMEWSHNTTNNPFFPTRGTLLSAGPLFAADDATYVRFNRDTTHDELIHEKTHTVGLSLVAAHYWELSERNSVSLRGEADLRRTTGKRNELDLEDDYTPSSVRAAWSRSLWSQERVAEDGDMRLEASLRYMTGRKDYQFVRNHSTFANIAWVRRNAWGTMRLGVGYAW
ncbi:MAG TPA: BamA/TamA family outer membrane protein [Thermoanaerobaculia bacterium]|jgi:outer membrane protein assembly factor BamA|nr:BamA/TamA family outer membrane protein [Thermoanaerobaculia bacterium]